jgi:hypothetical protein
MNGFQADITMQKPQEQCTPVKCNKAGARIEPC